MNKPVRHDLHPTTKPVERVERAVHNSSKRRDLVLDPRYVEVIVRRWQDWTGRAAQREADGVRFDGLAAESAAA